MKYLIPIMLLFIPPNKPKWTSKNIIKSKEKINIVEWMLQHDLKHLKYTKIIQVDSWMNLLKIFFKEINLF
jgi:hypothetical protein